jgi:hypothetical protein
MSIELESVKAINSLKQGIEATTGETYTDLTEAVQAMKDGYGQGGGGGLPDWDDDSPIIASGRGVNNTSAWEITEKGTLRWLVVFDTGANTSGFDSTSASSIVSYSNDFAKNAYKVKQAYVSDGFEKASFVCLPNCERIRVPYGLEKVLINFVGLKEVDFSGIYTMRDGQCQNCFRLESVVLNPLWTTLPSNAFRSCIALKEINLENITDFKNYCLMETISLDSVVFNENLTNIEKVANSVLAKNGFNYTAKARILEEEFPERKYQDLTLEEGIYKALIIELGSGTGNNWWCVVYPPLCFTGEGVNYVYKSKIYEIIKEIQL